MIAVGEGLGRIGFELRQQIIWAKTLPVIGRSAYNWPHEPCWYAVRAGKTASWLGDHLDSTVWEFASPKMIMAGSAEEKFDHPTQKPIEGMARPIRHHAGDVYDPFVGSGTTVVAAETLGRRCYAMEIDPEVRAGRDRALASLHGAGGTAWVGGVRHRPRRGCASCARSPQRAQRRIDDHEQSRWAVRQSTDSRFLWALHSSAPHPGAASTASPHGQMVLISTTTVAMRGGCGAPRTGYAPSRPDSAPVSSPRPWSGWRPRAEPRSLSARGWWPSSPCPRHSRRRRARPASSRAGR